jgi:hypothetical protein
MWNSDKQSISLGHKNPGTRPISRVDLRERFVGVCVRLLNDVDFSGTANGVNAMALLIVEDLIGIAGDSDLRNNVARIRVEYDKLRWKAASDKQSVIRFIESHRKISEGEIGFPRRSDSAFLAIVCFN